MVKGADAQIVFSLVEVNFIWFHFLAWFNLPFIKIVGASHNPRVYLLCNTATAVYVVSTYFYLNWVLLGFLSLAIMLDFFGINIEKNKTKKHDDDDMTGAVTDQWLEGQVHFINHSAHS